jgi:pimeloyl-[acyl-carrier protein] methyl ester esterase
VFLVGENKFFNKTIEVGDSVINYNVSEKHHKNTLILQHGAFINNITMMGLAGIFGDYTVIVPDMPNHGKSVTPYELDSVESLAEIEYKFILKLIETAEIEKDADITYVGWSLGSSIGLEIAIKEKIFNRLILIGSSPIWETLPPIPEELLHDIIVKFIFDGFSKDITPQRLQWVKDNIESMISAPAACMTDIIAIHKFDVIDKLSSIDIPVLMIAGGKDYLAIPSRQITMIENIPDSKLVLMGNEGHCTVVGCPEKVYTEMEVFLSAFLKKPATV